MSSGPPVPPRPGPSSSGLEAQDSVTPSEEWASEDEDDEYGNYYGEEDTDVYEIASGRLF